LPHRERNTHSRLYEEKKIAEHLPKTIKKNHHIWSVPKLLREALVVSNKYATNKTPR